MDIGSPCSLKTPGKKKPEPLYVLNKGVPMERMAKLGEPIHHSKNYSITP
ncbi:hypothetical protein I3760_13G082500 [Carya illinoinensis]|nr:hypothetical protein I3760_13G082500 [Carya illinoinensis]